MEWILSAVQDKSNVMNFFALAFRYGDPFLYNKTFSGLPKVGKETTQFQLEADKNNLFTLIL